MSSMEWLVVVSGIGAIAWVNWYFFFADRGPARAGGVGRGTKGDA